MQNGALLKTKEPVLWPSEHSF